MCLEYNMYIIIIYRNNYNKMINKFNVSTIRLQKSKELKLYIMYRTKLYDVICPEIDNAIV